MELISFPFFQNTKRREYTCASNKKKYKRVMLITSTCKQNFEKKKNKSKKKCPQSPNFPNDKTTGCPLLLLSINYLF